LAEVARDEIDAVLKRVLELPSTARERFLDDTCERDSDLRQAVERLLKNAEDADDPLLQPGAGASGPLWEALASEYTSAFLFEPGERIGAYRVVRTVGRGGMATVYLAERADGQFEQAVALKVLDVSRDFESLSARFAQERRILAKLEHPNIARLIDSGATRSGQPYVVMEYVDGEPVDQYCDRQRLSIEQRIRLFMHVASAVQYAHGHLIVHRDIKPSNILVTTSGEPKLLDFGIAKLLGADDAAPVTRSAVHPMTPEYASPEQVRGELLTTASDVYQLGYLLYHLLTGRSPYACDRRNVAAVIHAICDVEPGRPSALVTGPHDPGKVANRVDEVSVGRATTIERLRRRLAGDLDNILMMALSKDPARRYPSASHFRDDLRRHLEGLPVTARQDSFGYRTRKFISRHRAGVAATVLGILSLTVGFSVALWQAQEKAAEAANAEEVTNFMLSLFEQADPELPRAGDAMTVLDLLEQGSVRVEEELARQPETRASLFKVLGAVFLRVGAYERALVELDRSMELARTHFGPEDPRVADILHEMGHAHDRIGNFEEGGRLHRQALDLREKSFGNEHKDVASSMRSLGNSLIWTGDYAGGEQLLRDALALGISIYGPEHQQVAATLDKLAEALRLQGKHDEAEAYIREAVRQERLLLGPDHVYLASSLGSLSALLNQKGDYLESAEVAREALAIRQRALGVEHPSVADSMVNVAGALYNQARFDEAADYYRQALSIQRKVHGHDNMRVAHSLLTLASTLQAGSDFEEALASVEEALEILSRLPEENHLWVASGHQIRGVLLYEQGRLDEAEADLVLARDIIVGTWGGKHPQMGNVFADYGKILLARHRVDEAESAFRSSLEIRREQFGEANMFVADVKAWLARCMLEDGRLAEAEPLLLESYPVLAESLGADYPDTVAARQALVALHTRLDKPLQAAKYE
jgi:eukaryotic-like serine/threonine-protein kinase